MCLPSSEKKGGGFLSLKVVGDSIKICMYSPDIAQKTWNECHRLSFIGATSGIFSEVVRDG